MRIIACIFVFLLAMALAGCGKEAPPPEPGEASSIEEPAEPAVEEAEEPEVEEAPEAPAE